MDRKKLKPETLELIDGNKHTIDTLWLGLQIENKAELCFEFVDEVRRGILVGLGVYNYLVVFEGKETLVNKSHVKSIELPKKPSN